jgi:hypothetical protein
MNTELAPLNDRLRGLGLCEIALVAPEDCIGQKKNARYFTPEKFQQLVKNIKRDGRLESVPLVYRADGAEKYTIISGHHRVEAAKEAGLAQILVFLTTPESRDEIVSKQIAHNELAGKDDAMILAELFGEIQDMDLRLATGLNDAIAKISYASLNFHIGEFKEMVLLFLPEQIEELDAAMQEIATATLADKNSTVRLASLNDYEKFTATLRQLKKVENIKSNATAVMRMAELAQLQLQSQAQEAA